MSINGVPSSGATVIGVASSAGVATGDGAETGQDGQRPAAGLAEYVYDLDRPLPVGLPELTRLIGAKAANLAVMATKLDLPVPPGFTVTTAACNAYLATGWPAGLEDELRAHLDRMAERIGRRFGDPANPMLVSVRSGAPASMPGMMDTILDLGLNDATAAGLAELTVRPGLRRRLPPALPPDVPGDRGQLRARRPRAAAPRRGRGRVPVLEQ